MKWVSCSTSNYDCNSFHMFLEDIYSKALLKKQICESCQSKVEDKKVFTICKKSGQTQDNCYQNKFKGNIIASVSDMDNCSVCSESLCESVVRHFIIVQL